MEKQIKIGDTVRFVCNRMDEDGGMLDTIMKVTGTLVEIEAKHNENTNFPKYHIKRNGKMYWYSGDNLQLIKAKQITMEKQNSINWFTKSFIENNNFRITEDDGKYGKAESVKPNGYITLSFNRDGCNLSYEGKELEQNIFIELKLDGDTRKVFHGIIYNGEDFRRVLQLIR